jgi:hypothetical protein
MMKLEKQNTILKMFLTVTVVVLFFMTWGYLTTSQRADYFYKMWSNRPIY